MRVSRGTVAFGMGAVADGSRAAVTAVLCVLMVGQPVLAGATPVKRGPTAGGAQILGDARILHALNRLSFGPKPGDVAAVKAIGLNAWFEMQLNPSKIDDSALDARLAQYPAMQMPESELIARFPDQQRIKQMAQRNGYVPLPSDPVERAIYADNIAFYKIQQARQAARAAAAPAGAAGAGDSMAGDSMAGAATAGDSMVGGAAPAANATPAPGGRRAGRIAAQAGSVAGGGMAGGTSGGASDAMGGGAVAAPPPGQDMADANTPPAQHVEALYKDLDAVNIINLPPDERMRKVLAMNANEFVAFRQSLSGGESQQFQVGLNPQQREIFGAMQGGGRIIGSEELQARLIRDIYSDRQLEAVMTDFWLNHFNVYIRKNGNFPYLIPAYERETIRPNALGKFEDLLVATAKSPAMLTYLDNSQSIGPDSKAAKQGPGYGGGPRPQGAGFGGPRPPQNPLAMGQTPPPARPPQQRDRGLNENYGRELMELHTLGVNGGYTQADVTQVAKVFTGWTVAQGGRGGGPGRGMAPDAATNGGFQFDDRRHEPGSKTVLGKTIAESGMNEGLQVLHMLATSPATAKFISTKLAVRFVSDNPPDSLVDAMAKSFLDSGGDIKTVLRTMFEAPEFWSQSVERAKVKTPEEFVVSAVRASGATVNNPQALVQALDRLGMPLYGMQTPNGYSWQSEPWVSTGALVSRMNFALAMAGDRLPGTRTDWAKLLAGPAMTAKPVSMDKPVAGAMQAPVDPVVAAKEKKLESILLGETVSSRTRATVIGQSGDTTAAIEAAKEFQGGGGRGGGGGGGFGGRANGPNGGGAFGQGTPDDRQAAVMAGLLLGSPEFQRR